MNKLENSNLIIEVSEFGAELSRLYSKKYDKDFLWCGDSKYWGRKSPVLFPIVGRLKDNEIIIEEEAYNMSQHGFARDCKFQLVSKTEENITYSLNANEETKSKFPYNFKLNITYVLNEDSVEVCWNVKNVDNKEMYFSIGAHPAFNVPFNEGDNLEDYYITYEAKGLVEEYIMEPPFIKEKVNLENLKDAAIKPEMFKNDALIYSGVDKVTINSKNSKMNIAISCKDFPFVGIWSPYYEADNSIAPFVCIEPWCGLADEVDSNKDIKCKLGINKLEPNEEFRVSYRIIIG